MPRYFFDTCNGHSLSSDDEGRELPDIKAARREAIEDAKELIAEAIFRADNATLGEVRVRPSADDDWVVTVPFKEVIEGLRC